MKIAFVRARYSAHGGAERFAARAVAVLADATRDAFDVSILARRWDERGLDGAGHAHVVRLDPFYLGSTWRDASFARAVLKHVARVHYDLVQSHERIPGLDVYRAGDGVHASWLARRASALTKEGQVGLALNGHHQWLVQMERRMFEHPKLRAVICNSTMVRDEIVAGFAIDPSKLVLIRNGVDLERFRPEPASDQRQATRARLGIPAAAPVFVLVGSGFERKGVALALDAIRQLPAAHLVVVGADKNRERYQASAADLASRVRFVGAVDDPRPYLAAADVFVLPTLYDPFPNAALEAWATGLPVITSDACGAAELIEQAVNGWVVGSHDRAALLAAMRDAATRDAARVASMARAARRTAEPLSLAATADALVALYRRLLTQSAST